MKIGTFAIAAGALALGLASWITPGKAQGPLWDVVHVNLPYTVTVGDHTLQPGEYTIQQLRDQGGNSRVLLIYSDSGMKFETSAMTIPAVDPSTPEDTRVLLHHVGPDYYFDKIWIQGKNYGYEFPLPSSVRAREQEQMAGLTVPATYSTTPAEAETATTKQATTTAAATQSQTTTPATTESQTTAPAATQSQTTAPAATSPTTMAQNTTPQPPAATPAPTMQPENNMANREMPETTTAPRTMPSTSAGWLMMLLGGGTLSGAGLMLRRKR